MENSCSWRNRSKQTGSAKTTATRFRFSWQYRSLIATNVVHRGSLEAKKESSLAARYERGSRVVQLSRRNLLGLAAGLDGAAEGVLLVFQELEVHLRTQRKRRAD